MAAQKNPNFLYGIGKVTFAGQVLGYIEKGSFDFGSTDPELTEIEAEQVPGAPVLTLRTKDGKLKPTFNLIQLDYKNLHNVLGGELVGGSSAPTGWKAPAQSAVLNGACVIELVSGQKITFENASLTASLTGKLTLTEVVKLKCTLTVNAPTNGGAPYKIENIG